MLFGWRFKQHHRGTSLVSVTIKELSPPLPIAVRPAPLPFCTASRMRGRVARSSLDRRARLASQRSAPRGAAAKLAAASQLSGSDRSAQRVAAWFGAVWIAWPGGSAEGGRTIL